MDDGLGPPTPEDIVLEAHVRLRAADGTEIAKIDIEERLLRGVLLQCDPNGADERLAVHFYSSIVAPIRARLDKFVDRLRRRQPANAHFARIDAFYPERAHMKWWDEPHAPLEQKMVQQIDRALSELHNRKLDID